MANHKPGSVPIAARSLGAYHLSSTLLTQRVNQPTLQVRRAALSAEACPGIFGLSARKVYLALHITEQAVSSYLTFSPFPRQAEVVSLSAALSVIHNFCRGLLPVRKYDALCCPDFPLFFRKAID
ncbi:MAG: hypothetical protein RLZZ301_1171 [Bacteroidota bacterium]